MNFDVFCICDFEILFNLSDICKETYWKPDETNAHGEDYDDKVMEVIIFVIGVNFAVLIDMLLKLLLVCLLIFKIDIVQLALEKSISLYLFRSKQFFLGQDFH